MRIPNKHNLLYKLYLKFILVPLMALQHRTYHSLISLPKKFKNFQSLCSLSNIKSGIIQLLEECFDHLIGNLLKQLISLSPKQVKTHIDKDQPAFFLLLPIIIFWQLIQVYENREIIKLLQPMSIMNFVSQFLQSLIIFNFFCRILNCLDIIVHIEIQISNL